MIGIVDYGLGNIQSVVNAVCFCGEYPCQVMDRPEDLLAASKLILPGVGAFGEAMDHILSRELDTGIRAVAKKGVPILGICLGMQLLATRSREFGLTRGLDLIPGEILPLEEEERRVRIPHMGWNNVIHEADDPLFQSIGSGADFYFAHSFHFSPKDIGHGIAVTDYGGRFYSAVRKDKIFGVQFHPEKSQEAGLQLIKNFLEKVAGC